MGVIEGIVAAVGIALSAYSAVESADQADKAAEIEENNARANRRAAELELRREQKEARQRAATTKTGLLAGGATVDNIADLLRSQSDEESFNSGLITLGGEFRAQQNLFNAAVRRENADAELVGGALNTADQAAPLIASIVTGSGS